MQEGFFINVDQEEVGASELLCSTVVGCMFLKSLTTWVSLVSKITEVNWAKERCGHISDLYPIIRSFTTCLLEVATTNSTLIPYKATPNLYNELISTWHLYATKWLMDFQCLIRSINAHGLLNRFIFFCVSDFMLCWNMPDDCSDSVFSSTISKDYQYDFQHEVNCICQEFISSLTSRVYE